MSGLLGALWRVVSLYYKNVICQRRNQECLSRLQHDITYLLICMWLDESDVFWRVFSIAILFYDTCKENRRLFGNVYHVTFLYTCRSKENGPVKLWDQEMKRCKAFSIHERGSKADVVKSVCRIKVWISYTSLVLGSICHPVGFMQKIIGIISQGTYCC